MHSDALTRLCCLNPKKKELDSFKITSPLIDMNIQPCYGLKAAKLQVTEVE